MEISTSGHGPSKGYSGMLNHLKDYLRKKGDKHQKNVDEAFTRSGKLGKKAHGKALRRNRSAIGTFSA